MENAKGSNLCLLCMQYHDMQEVEVRERAIFKEIEFETINKKLYCEFTDEYLITEEYIKENDMRLKDAYREKVGLLTSKEIQDIRKKYEISQKELSRILEWGELTITRYENHQVQDKAHDDVLSEIKSNPLFLYDKLKMNKDQLSDKSYGRLIKNTTTLLSESENLYLTNSIVSGHIQYSSDKYQGNTSLNLTKVVEMINYIAKRVSNLYLVKLMKIIWYSDFLHYKKYDKGITGLYYFKNTMGALPKDYDKIILLAGVSYVEEYLYDNICKRFIPSDKYSQGILSVLELETIDLVIGALGNLNSKEIVELMHEEDAFNHTKEKHPISYEMANSLKLQ